MARKGDEAEVCGFPHRPWYPRTWRAWS